MIFVEKDKSRKWHWVFALTPTRVGFDEKGKLITVWLQWYQSTNSILGIFAVLSEKRLPGITKINYDPWVHEHAY